MEKVKVGVIGCGNISDIYFKNLSSFSSLEVVACADLNEKLAKDKANEHHLPESLSVNELLTHPEIELILNLTPPKVHAEISLLSLEHDKHVYSEKPLAVSKEEGQLIINLAKEKNLFVGSAPDTFLGSGIQTCLDLVQKGEIGTPVAATAIMMNGGPEQWHPNPEFFYQEGAGPLFDMGPYYLTALIQLLGPIDSVFSSSTINFPERVIKTGEKQGKVIKVETPTHFSGNLEFESGAVATMIMSFDVSVANPPSLEIYGAEGTIRVPDPNHFGGPVLLKKKDEYKWREIELQYPYTENSRGIGLLDMVSSLQHATPFRANGELAYHVLETMVAFCESSEMGERRKLESSCKPAPLLAENSILNQNKIGG
ncbi:Gfo/Idh/MocA family protein [Halobacillus andaensis]|uniref:Gfo/Idh/MocA family protein n=1 Tax=Halobacillus andaensis TaxID=1176239 RepID=UPI003D74D9A5